LRNFVLLGLAPLTGALMLFGVGNLRRRLLLEDRKRRIGSNCRDHSAIWFGVGGMIIGIAAMLISRPYFKEFFARKTETAPPGILDRPPIEAIPGASRLLAGEIGSAARGPSRPRELAQAPRALSRTRRAA